MVRLLMGLEKPANRSKKIETLASQLQELLEKNREIASQQSPNSIVPEYKTSKEIHKELTKIYNFLAETFGYKTMDHMIAVAHTVLIAEAIANPAKMGSQTAIKAIEQAQANIRPPAEKATAGKIAQEAKPDIIKRLVEHLSQAPSKPKVDWTQAPPSKDEKPLS